MKLSRYQTYVFDMEPKPEADPKKRELLGPLYKGGVPCAWSDGHALQDADRMREFIQWVADNASEMDSFSVSEAANELLNELN